MCLTFQIVTLEKYSNKNIAILFRGYPHFGPSNCIVSKNDHPSTAYDITFFYCRILFYSKNVDVFQKLELNTIRFDGGMRVPSWKKTSSIFPLYPSANEKHHKSVVFQDFFGKMPGSKTPGNRSA